MKKLVKVYRRDQMQYVDPDPSVNLITIWSRNFMARSQYTDGDVPMKGWNDIIKLEFDDVVGESRRLNLIPFNSKMAEELLDFIQKHEGEEFAVHCDAGMSRSVAVGCFLRDNMDYDMELYSIGTDKHRNIIILNLLRRAYYGVVEEIQEEAP